MLSGSAVLRVLLLLVSAAGIAALLQHFLAGGPAAPEPPAVTAPQTARVPETAPPVPPRPAETRPEEPRPPDEVRTIPLSPTETPVPSPAPAPPEPAPLPAPPAEPAVPESAPDAARNAAENAPPAAVDLVDLNTASLSELNALQGGGAIGKTIIQHRPYASVDQLLSKRVLNRATYQRIKDQVTVR